MTSPRRILALLCAAVVAFTIVSIPATANAAHQKGLHIGLVQFDSPGKDTGSNTSLNAEWVNIHNATSKPIQLKGYQVKDKAGHVYTFPSYTVGAGKNVKLHTGKGTNGKGHVYWGRAAYVWNNTGDTATLLSPSGAKKDSCSWKKTANGKKNCH